MFIRSKRFISSLLCLALVFSLLGTFGLGSVQAEAGIEGYTPAMTVSELKPRERTPLPEALTAFRVWTSYTILPSI